MRVDWTDHAKRQRKQIADYIRERFGFRSARKFRQEVTQVTNLIIRHPNIAPIDPLFADRPIAYRSIIINGLSKMIYYIEGNIIYIAAIWDTRCDSLNQAAQTE